MLWSFAVVSQLRNGGSCAAKWHSCAKLSFAVAKIFTEESIELRNDFAKDGRFRRDTLIPQRLLLGCETVSQQSANFAEDSLRLRNLADPCFCPFFRFERLPFNFFAFSPDFDHPKTYITSKQIRIKALKSKLKQVKKQNKKIWTS